MACSPGSPASSVTAATVGRRVFPHWLRHVDVELMRDLRTCTRTDVTLFLEMVFKWGPLRGAESILSPTEIWSGSWNP